MVTTKQEMVKESMYYRSHIASFDVRIFILGIEICLTNVYEEGLIAVSKMYRYRFMFFTFVNFESKGGHDKWLACC